MIRRLNGIILIIPFVISSTSWAQFNDLVGRAKQANPYTAMGTIEDPALKETDSTEAFFPDKSFGGFDSGIFDIESNGYQTPTATSVRTNR